MPVRVVINEAELGRLLTAPGSPLVTAVRTAGKRVESQAKVNAPVNNGRLRASIRSTTVAVPGRITARIGTDLPYAIYQEKGTGVYAGRGPIRPRRSQFLRFKPKGSKGFVYARQVRGTPPVRFLERALRTASPWPVVSSGNR
ncbi:HK97 gp10 family phage protein [Streptomyces sp. NBC_01304]|uniref:HK97 gp10 family phage protein n=1 Tax=Streptomyces sp. NBC_01304 TaxID=2903818 RepID=UPI002E11B126|nr:HK97 gp10 family phage protein [Streptomyces sp. NBC_01304]